MRVRDRGLIIMGSQGLTQVTTLVLSMILVRIVSKGVFGTYQQVNLVYLSIASAISLQLHSSLYYFIPKLGENRRGTLLFQSILITLGMSVIIGGLMFVGAGLIAERFENPALVPLIRVFALYPFVERIIILIPAFMISMDKSVRAGVYTLVSSIGRIVPVVVAFSLGCELVTVFWSIIAVGALIALVGCADMVRFCPGDKWRVDRRLVAEQMNFAWPLVAVSVVGMINLQLNKILIAMVFDKEVYAVYSCGAIQLPIIAMVTSSLGAAMMPELVSMVSNGKFKDALSTWQEAARKCSFVIFPCFAFFLVIAHDFIVLLYQEEYSMASWPFMVYLFSLPIRVAIYATLFRASGKTKPIAAAAVISLIVNIILSTALVLIGNGNMLSYVGPAIGAVIASWISWLYLLGKLTSLTGVSFSSIMRWKELLIILLVCVGCGFVIDLLPMSNLPIILRLTLKAIIYGALFVLTVFSFGLLQDDEKDLLKIPFRVARKVLSKRRG